MSSFTFDRRREVVVRDQEHQNDRLGFVIEKLVKLELKLEEQSKTILRQEREINELKSKEIENKIIFERELEKLRDQVNKENSELFHLIEVQHVEICELKQKLQQLMFSNSTNTNVYIRPELPVSPTDTDPPENERDRGWKNEPPILAVGLEYMSAGILRLTQTDHSPVTNNDCDQDKIRSHDAQFYELLNG